MLDQLKLPYLIEASLIIALGYVLYRVLFASDKAYIRNRIYLLSLLLLSFLLPLISLPVYARKMVLAPLRTAEILTTSSSNVITPSSFDWNAMVAMIYFVGVALLSLRLIYHITYIISVINKSESVVINGVKHVLTDKLTTPASVFRVLLTDDLDLPQAVLDHEKIHMQHGHTWDVLLMEVVKIVLWFNPFVYYVSKQLKYNHEFIADFHAAKYLENELDYSSLLLQYAKSIKTPLLLNTFSSITKKRIIMLSKKSTNNPWKSFLMLPILCVFVSLFSCESYTENDSITVMDNLQEIRIDTILELDPNTGVELMTIEKVYLNDVAKIVDTILTIDIDNYEEEVQIVESVGPRKEVLLSTYSTNEYNRNTGNMETNTYHVYPQEMVQVIDTIISFDMESYEEKVTIIEGARPRQELISTKVTPENKVKDNQKFDNVVKEKDKIKITINGN